MSDAVGFSMPCFVLAFLVCRVADQSFSSGLLFTTSRGNVSGFLLDEGKWGGEGGGLQCACAVAAASSRLRRSFILVDDGEMGLRMG